MKNQRSNICITFETQHGQFILMMVYSIRILWFTEQSLQKLPVDAVLKQFCDFLMKLSTLYILPFRSNFYQYSSLPTASCVVNGDTLLVVQRSDLVSLRCETLQIPQDLANISDCQWKKLPGSIPDRTYFSVASVNSQLV